MDSTLINIFIAISASALSGLITAIYASRIEKKKDEIRRYERDQDGLKLDLKDAQIKLYQLEKDLTDWKDKYYLAIQEMIEIKAELEQALIKIELIENSSIK